MKPIVETGSSTPQKEEWCEKWEKEKRLMKLLRCARTLTFSSVQEKKIKDLLLRLEKDKKDRD